MRYANLQRTMQFFDSLFSIRFELENGVMMTSERPSTLWHIFSILSDSFVLILTPHLRF